MTYEPEQGMEKQGNRHGYEKAFRAFNYLEVMYGQVTSGSVFTSIGGLQLFWYAYFCTVRKSLWVCRVISRKDNPSFS